MKGKQKIAHTPTHALARQAPFSVVVVLVRQLLSLFCHAAAVVVGVVDGTLCKSFAAVVLLIASCNLVIILKQKTQLN